MGGVDLRFEGVDADPHFIFDHTNNVYEHGFPYDDRVWTLASKGKKRAKKSDGEKILKAKVCPGDCFKSVPISNSACKCMRFLYIP